MLLTVLIHLKMLDLRTFKKQEIITFFLRFLLGFKYLHGR
jgi:hypothetical protein